MRSSTSCEGWIVDPETVEGRVRLPQEPGCQETDHFYKYMGDDIMDGDASREIKVTISVIMSMQLLENKE